PHYVSLLSHHPSHLRYHPSFPTRRSSDLTTVDELAALMVSRSVSFKTEKSPNHPGNTVLKVENLHVKDSRKVPVVKGLSLDVREDRKSTRLNSSHVSISYAVFCLKKKIQ